MIEEVKWKNECLSVRLCKFTPRLTALNSQPQSQYHAKGRDRLIFTYDITKVISERCVALIKYVYLTLSDFCLLFSSILFGDLYVIVSNIYWGLLYDSCLFFGNARLV